MNLNKSKIFLPLFCIFLIFLTACASAPPQNCKDELISNKWILYDNFNKQQGYLSFNDNNITLNIQTGENSPFIFNEKCLIDENKITVTSNNYGTLNMEYKISGQNLSLSYFGKKIYFKKK